MRNPLSRSEIPYHPDPDGTWLSEFGQISLEETNRSAQMLKRIDNKYMLDKPALSTVLAELRDSYRVLTIGGQQLFAYQSCYFDDDGRCFREHHQGKRQRFKVRTRHYLDSGEIFFEVKLKGKRGQTDKSRERCDEFIMPTITGEQFETIRTLYEKRYCKPFHYRLQPALIVSYNRVTLVSVSGGERITIDTDIGFATPAGRQGVFGYESVIVETKSANGRGVADYALKKHHIRQAKGCSKYCLGLILTGEVQKYNNFRKTVKILTGRDESPAATEISDA
jgi:hypothetical protein